MTTQREFWAQKPVRQVYETIQFAHSAIGSIYLVSNVHQDVSLGGTLYTATRMDISRPAQGRDPIPRLRMAFPRIIVGQQFAVALKRIETSGVLEPIAVTYKLWIDGTVINEITLWVDDQDGVSMDAKNVTVTAADDNPMRRNISIIYDVATWTGLERV